MNILLKRILGASLALAAFSFITPSHVQAQTCVIPPTCESLGYEFTTADCADRPSLKCPFDTTKIYCLTQKEASEAGICLNVGDILYSDKTCSSRDNLVKGKTPIAVVVDPELRLAIALNEKTLQFATTNFDIPELGWYDPKSDWAGKSNTQIIINYCQANGYSCPAAEYAYNYTTTGTKAGDWYLPAIGELLAMYDNHSLLDGSLSRAGGLTLEKNFWSSSGWFWGWGAHWVFNIDDGSSSTSSKTSEHYVRPMIQF